MPIMIGGHTHGGGGGGGGHDNQSGDFPSAQCALMKGFGRTTRMGAVSHVEDTWWVRGD